MLRRVEAVSRASRAIMAGDLGQRMALRGTDDEFDHLSTSLNAMLDRIQDLMVGLQQVSSDIAHDLRTPLTRLRQRLELARRRENTVRGAERSPGYGDRQCRRASWKRSGRCCGSPRSKSGTRRAGFQPVALDALLNGLVEAYQPVTEEKAQDLRARIAPGLWVDGDRELLTQLFANLIDNAIGHSPPGARLSVAAETTPQGVRVMVGDTGPGIPEPYRQKVLQRFYRLEASRTTPGSGLGLSLVNAVAMLHDASLALQDNEPGLRCVLCFPARTPAPRPNCGHGASG